MGLREWWKALNSTSDPGEAFVCPDCGYEWFQYIAATRARRVEIGGNLHIIGGVNMPSFTALRNTNVRYLECLRCREYFDRRGLRL